MARLRLFGPAREAAGITEAVVDGSSVAAVLDAASKRFGESFALVVTASQIWVNGESADGADAVTDADEVAVIPPVSGG